MSRLKRCKSAVSVEGVLVGGGGGLDGMGMSVVDWLEGIAGEEREELARADSNELR